MSNCTTCQSFSPFIILTLFIIASFFIPWRRITWGNIGLTQTPSITVYGTAKSTQKNQLATFSAGISVVADDKEQAVDEVNQKMETIINKLIEFGIAEDDIKTENMSIYQRQETYYEEGREKSRQGQWDVSNSVSIKLRDVERASDLTLLLSDLGATNVWGPNFTTGDTADIEKDILTDAVADARVKAEKIASNQGNKLGNVLNITESGAYSPIYPLMRAEGAGGGGGYATGTEEVSKTVSVTFELK